LRVDRLDCDGYLAALVNFRFFTNDLWTTKEAVAKISSAKLNEGKNSEKYT